MTSASSMWISISSTSRLRCGLCRSRRATRPSGSMCVHGTAEPCPWQRTNPRLGSAPHRPALCRRHLDLHPISISLALQPLLPHVSLSPCSLPPSSLFPCSLSHHTTHATPPSRQDPNAAVPRMEMAHVPLHTTWAAMEALQLSGLARNIGVANVTTSGLRDLIASSRVPPAVLQVKLHPRDLILPYI